MRIYFNMLMFRERLDGTGYYALRLLRQLQISDPDSEYILLFPKSIKDPGKLFKIVNANFKIKQFAIGSNVFFRIFFEQFILPFLISDCILFSPSVSIPILPMCRVKRITTIHDLTPYYFPKKYPLIQRIYFNFISKYASKVSKLIVTVSQNSKNDIIHFFSIPGQKIKVIYNFLDFPGTEIYDDKKRAPFFITVSVIQPGKNLEGVIQSFNEYISITNSEFNLHIIGGKGWGYETIFDLVKKLNLENRIIFEGYVPEDRLIEYYRKASGLVYMSFYEGFGIPPLEALSYGCPVLVSNNSSLPEVTGEAAIYADPYDINSMVKGFLLLSTKEIVLQKSKYFEKEVRKFDGLIETSKLLDCFKSL